jgi:hypothetical protein
MIDPTGALVQELRTAGLASGRVYAGEVPPGAAKSPPAYQRFIVLVRLPAMRFHRTPLQEVRYVATCYGATYQDAQALYDELSDAIDNLGPRVGASSVPIYQSLDEGADQPASDPGTGQPFTPGTIALWVGTEALA